MRLQPLLTGMIVWAARIASVQAAPSSETHAIDRIVQPSAFHGVHGLAFDANGVLHAGSVAGQSIYRVDTRSGAAEIAIGAPAGMADDLTFLSDGTLVWTAIDQGIVRRRLADGSIKEIATGLPGINSIAQRKTDGRLFAAQVFGGDGLWELDPTGARPPRQILGAIGGLNGFDIGDDGMIYGPLWFKHQIVRIDPDTGALAVISDDFGIPAAANFDSHENLYVVDTQRGELVTVDVTSGKKKLIATVSPSLDNLAIDANDRIFVSNMADNGIQEIDPETGHVRQVLLGALALPYSVAAVSNDGGDELIVADLFAFRSVHTGTGRVHDIQRVWAANSPIHYTLQVSANDRHIMLVNTEGLVQQYDRQTYALIKAWTLKQAWAALEMPDGTIVALDGNGQVSRLEVDGTATPLVAGVGRYGTLALAGPGTLYVGQPSTGDILLVDLKDGSHRTIASGLQRPQAIAVAGDGTVIVVEMGPQRVSSLDPATGVSRVIARDLPLAIAGRSSSPVGVTVGTDGAIYVTSALENAIYRLRPSSQ